MSDPKGEFSVYWYTPDGSQIEEKRFVDAETAMNAVQRMLRSMTRQLGGLERIIITDGGDYTNFEWTKNKGLVFPVHTDDVATAT